MLDRTADAHREVELRRDDLAGLPHLLAVGAPARIDHGAAGADGRVAEGLGERLDDLELVRVDQAAAASHHDRSLLDVQLRVRLGLDGHHARARRALERGLGALGGARLVAGGEHVEAQGRAENRGRRGQLGDHLAREPGASGLETLPSGREAGAVAEQHRVEVGGNARREVSARRGRGGQEAAAVARADLGSQGLCERLGAGGVAGEDDGALGAGTARCCGGGTVTGQDGQDLGAGGARGSDGLEAGAPGRAGGVFDEDEDGLHGCCSVRIRGPWPRPAGLR